MTPAPRSSRLPRTGPVAGDNSPRFMKTAFLALATPLMIWGGLGLAAPTAQAAPCPNTASCQRWCPGDANPAGRPVPWDGSACHDYYWDYYGVHDVGTGAFYAWRDMPWH
ncbi:MAG: hypothetical protein QOC58_228 [Mycobacterium sp.]|jgi:hypothetical protein|nr:hypothetical protein [Mycobacterium sp.]